MKLRVYSYAKCSTCRNALKFLEQRGISFDVVPIQDQSPTRVELKKMLVHVGSIRKLFNTSGLSYRALNLKDRIDELSESEAMDLLLSDGMLVKRPFALSPEAGAVGFKQTEWEQRFGI